MKNYELQITNDGTATKAVDAITPRGCFRGWSSSFVIRNSLMIASLLLMGAAGSACVRRSITITTEPPNALVFLNDQEVGSSTVNTDFLWYGDYAVTIRKEGYRTLETNWEVKPPWYQWIPFDFFSEVLWPGQLHDYHERHFVLEPAEETNRDELIQRAIETREQAADTRG